MRSFKHDRNALCFQVIHYKISYLVRKPFLALESAGKTINNAGKSGTASLNKTLKAILADTPLVRNLENDEYYRIILNGCSTLAERFAQIDDKTVREQLKQAGKNQEKISPEIRSIIKQADLPEKISALFLGDGKISANCHLPQ